MKVAVPRPKHSPTFGQRALWQTVCSPMPLSCRPSQLKLRALRARAISQLGMRSLIASRLPLRSEPHREYRPVTARNTTDAHSCADPVATGMPLLWLCSYTA